MGQNKSKALKYPNHPPPPGYPSYGHTYPYAFPPQVGYGPGYHIPIIPGYGVPPNPQSFNWQPPERRRKKKRRSSSTRTATHQADRHRTIATGPNVHPVPAGMLDNLPPNFVPTSIVPNPPGTSGPMAPPALSGDNNSQGARPPPLFTPGVPGNAVLNDLPPPEPSTLRRTATPYIPAQAPNENSDEDDDESDEDVQQRPTHSRSRSHRRTASAPYNFGAMQPILPDDPIASPGIRPNPLPPPPRDLYEMSPYKQLLQLPTTLTLLTSTATNSQPGHANSTATVTRSATNPGMAGVGAGINASQSSLRKKKRGFFSFGSLRGRNPRTQPTQQHPLSNVQFVPIYQNTSQPSTAPTTGREASQPNTNHSANDSAWRREAGTPVPPIPTPPSPPQRSPPSEDSADDIVIPPEVYRSISPASHHTSHGVHAQPHQPQPQQYPQTQPNSQPQPQPYQNSQSPPSQPYLVSPNGSTIEFSHTSLPDFLNHSPHRVMFANKIYPSAMHLHEAMKFMEHKPDLAESIRKCENVEDVYPLTARLQVWVRPDWGEVFLDKMEDVLWHKFTQHQHIRTMLLKTGNARIVYSDPHDPYWGSGAPFGRGSNYPGTNYLGQLLEKVRDRLREREHYG